MTDKTVQEIRGQHGATAAGILAGYHAELDALREQREPEAGGYLERLSGEQRMTLLREQKREKADAARAGALDAYRREVDRYQDELSARAGYLSGGLFGMSTSEGTAALSRTALASEEELGTMLDLAARANNQELAQAVFVAADNRGFPGLVVRYFEEAAPGDRGFYAEWTEVPPPEVLERQRDTVEQIVAPPDYDRLEAAPLPNA